MSTTTAVAAPPQVDDSDTDTDTSDSASESASESASGSASGSASDSDSGGDDNGDTTQEGTEDDDESKADEVESDNDAETKEKPKHGAKPKPAAKAPAAATTLAPQPQPAAVAQPQPQSQPQPKAPAVVATPVPRPQTQPQPVAAVQPRPKAPVVTQPSAAVPAPRPLAPTPAPAAAPVPTPAAAPAPAIAPAAPSAGRPGVDIVAALQGFNTELTKDHVRLEQGHQQLLQSEERISEGEDRIAQSEQALQQNQERLLQNEQVAVANQKALLEAEKQANARTQAIADQLTSLRQSIAGLQTNVRSSQDNSEKKQNELMGELRRAEKMFVAGRPQQDVEMFSNRVKKQRDVELDEADDYDMDNDDDRQPLLKSSKEAAPIEIAADRPGSVCARISRTFSSRVGNGAFMYTTWAFAAVQLANAIAILIYSIVKNDELFWQMNVFAFHTLLHNSVARFGWTAFALCMVACVYEVAVTQQRAILYVPDKVLAGIGGNKDELRQLKKKLAAARDSDDRSQIWDWIPFGVAHGVVEATTLAFVGANTYYLFCFVIMINLIVAFVDAQESRRNALHMAQNTQFTAAVKGMTMLLVILAYAIGTNSANIDTDWVRIDSVYIFGYYIAAQIFTTALVLLTRHRHDIHMLVRDFNMLVLVFPFSWLIVMASNEADAIASACASVPIVCSSS